MYNATIEDLPVAPVRWIYALPMAAATTLGLLVLMYQLIFTEAVVIDPEPSPVMPKVYWEEPPPLLPELPKLDKPQTVKHPPQPPENKIDGDYDVAIAIPNGDYSKPEFNGDVVFNFDAPIEHFIVRPRYPGTALRRGIEGYVELRFDVTPIGTTENIEVLRAEPPGIFERSAIRAAERWKYQPKTVEGKPVYFRGLSKRVTFEMQEG